MFKDGDKVLVKATVEKVTDDYVRIYAEGYGERSFSLENAPVEPKTYEQGLADAWELARNVFHAEALGGMSTDEMEKVFNTSLPMVVLENFTAAEALAKIEAYEREKEIGVNDEVIVCTMSGSEYVAVVTCKHDNEADVMYKGGNVANHVPLRLLKKTGKRIDIEGLLKQIGE